MLNFTERERGARGLTGERAQWQWTKPRLKKKIEESRKRREKKKPSGRFMQISFYKKFVLQFIFLFTIFRVRTMKKNSI